MAGQVQASCGETVTQHLQDRLKAKLPQICPLRGCCRTQSCRFLSLHLYSYFSNSSFFPSQILTRLLLREVLTSCDNSCDLSFLSALWQRGRAWLLLLKGEGRLRAARQTSRQILRMDFCVALWNCGCERCCIYLIS